MKKENCMIEVAGVTEELKACGPYALGRADEYTESTGELYNPSCKVIARE